MYRTGAALLFVWLGFNLLLAAGILAALILFEKDAPALSILLSEAEIRALPGNVRATANALAVLTNGLIAAVSALAIVLLAAGLPARDRLVLPALAGCLAFIQLCGFASDSLLGHRNLLANCVSSALLGAGLVLATAGLRLRRR